MNTLYKLRLARKTRRALVLQERREVIELGKKLAGLTDPNYLDRALGVKKSETELALEAVGKSLRSAGLSISDMNKSQERRRTNKKAYNRKRGLIQ